MWIQSKENACQYLLEWNHSLYSVVFLFSHVLKEGLYEGLLSVDGYCYGKKTKDFILKPNRGLSVLWHLVTDGATIFFCVEVLRSLMNFMQTHTSFVCQIVYDVMYIYLQHILLVLLSLIWHLEFFLFIFFMKTGTSGMILNVTEVRVFTVWPATSK